MRLQNIKRLVIPTDESIGRLMLLTEKQNMQVTPRGQFDLVRPGLGVSPPKAPA